MKSQSNAYNFSEYISSGVDPRTGTFSMQINMGNFLSYKGSGISIPLVVSHDAFSKDSGFGRGWSFPLSQFNKSRRSLKLSSGQSFQIKWNSEKNEYDIPYRKLKDIHVLKDNKTNEIIVLFKGGRKEYIDYDLGTCSKIVSAQGLAIHLLYSQLHGRRTLSKIHDDQNRVIEFDFLSDKFETKVSHSLNGMVIQRFIFTKRGPDLALMRFHIEGVNEYTTFEYAYFKESDYKPIKTLTHPSGLIENLYYNNKQYLPRNAPVEFYPCISKHIIVPGENQEIQQRDYSFSNKNYLGFASDRGWNQSEDVLFKARYDYQYSSTEIINEDKKTVKTYNKYHLLTSEKSYKKNRLYVKTTYEYFADTRRSIELQPAQYSLLKKQVTTYYFDGQQRELTLEYEYDEYANKIKETLADGNTIDRKFYPIEGDGSSCPKDPFGMVSMLKLESETDKETSAKTRVSKMKYVALPSLDGISSFIVLSERTEYDGVAEKYDYYTDLNESLLGRMKKVTRIFNGYEASLEYDYGFSNADYFTLTTTATSHDNISVKTHLETDPFFMNEIKKTGPEGEVLKTLYDERGREISTTIFPDKDYSATSKIEYLIGDNNNKIIETDSKGNQIKKELNNAGKIIRISIQEKDSFEFKKVKETFYDAFGQVIRDIDIDILPNGRKIELTTKFEYDENGDVNKTVHPDGRIEEIIQNPVELTTKHIQVGLLEVISTFNVSGELIKKETKEHQGEIIATSTHEYDLWGHQIKTTDTTGNVIETEYGSHDRVKSVTRYIDGKVVVEYFSYPDFTTSDAVSEVKLDDIVMGRREYDGLLRIKKELSVGIPTSYTYEGNSSRISTVTKPRSETESNTVTFTYEPILKSVISRKTNPPQNIDATFTYDKKTGLLIEALNPSSKITYEYDHFNRVIKETVNLNNGQERYTSFTYSLQGKIIGTVDFLGNRNNFDYDPFGRIHTVFSSVGNLTHVTNFSYDAFSRQHQFHTQTQKYEKSTINIVSISLEFNAIGAEIKRTAKINSRTSFVISQEYTKNMQLSQRIYEMHNESNNETTKETFLYDDLNRITEYHAEGKMAPVDEKGKTITDQAFKHDKYGNIIEVINTMKGEAKKNTRTFSYIADNPALLGRVKNSHSAYISDFECKYDAQGNLFNDESGLEYAYNVLGQVDTVYSDAAGRQFLTSYHYDPLGQMVSQKDKEQNYTYFYYVSGALTHEINGDAFSTYIPQGSGSQIRHVKNNSENQWQILLGNAQGSVIETLTLDDVTGAITKKERKNYTVYGESAPMK